jgi:hypothetical protein
LRYFAAEFCSNTICPFQEAVIPVFTGQGVAIKYHHRDWIFRSIDKFESDIMAEVAKGDLSAFREIVERYQHPLLSYIYRYTGDRTAAEDIAQEVFLRLFKGAKEYRHYFPLRPGSSR